MRFKTHRNQGRENDSISVHPMSILAKFKIHTTRSSQHANSEVLLMFLGTGLVANYNQEMNRCSKESLEKKRHRENCEKSRKVQTDTLWKVFNL